LKFASGIFSNLETIAVEIANQSSQASGRKLRHRVEALLEERYDLLRLADKGSDCLVSFHRIVRTQIVPEGFQSSAQQLA
jgi:hypothetical protein